MERRPQRGTNRGRSGMVARSTDGHKTNASPGAEPLGGDGIGGVNSLELFSCSVSLLTTLNASHFVLTYYRANVRFLLDDAKG